MRFACDVMLGKLARYLRILGFDAAYVPGNIDLSGLRDQENPRLFLTRRRKAVVSENTLYIRAENVREQLKELKGLIRPLIDPDKLLGRCIDCNVPLADVKKEVIEHRVPEFVFHTYNAFKICPRCDRVYWAGTHAKQMSQLMEEMTGIDFHGQTSGNVSGEHGEGVGEAPTGLPVEGAT
jgi:uncharacterized protein